MCNFAYFNHDYELESQQENTVSWAASANAFPASAALKSKFRFPSKDPDEHTMIDSRTDEQKVNDILRIWSQVLDPQELELWSDIAERDISHDISLTSGIRTPKTFVDAELKKYKSAKAKQRKDILQSAHKAPDFSDPVPDICSEKYEHRNGPLRDPLSILPDELCVDQAFLAKLSPPTQASANRPCNQDLEDPMIAQTLEECR